MICRFPACHRLTIDGTALCDHHRHHAEQFKAGAATLSSAWTRAQAPQPQGSWAIADRIRREGENDEK